MTIRRKIMVAFLLLLMIFAGGACGDDVDHNNVNPSSSPSVTETDWEDVGGRNALKRVTIDGVDCVVADGNRAVSVSCDWENKDVSTP